MRHAILALRSREGYIPFALGIVLPILVNALSGGLGDFFIGNPRSVVSGFAFSLAAIFAVRNSQLRPSFVAALIFAGVSIGSTLDASARASRLFPDSEIMLGVLYWWAEGLVPILLGSSLGLALRKSPIPED